MKRREPPIPVPVSTSPAREAAEHTPRPTVEAPREKVHADPVHACCGTLDFSGSALSIAWECHDEGQKVRGRLWLRPDGADSTLRFDLDPQRPTYTFDLGRKVSGRLWLAPGSTTTLHGDLQLSASEVFDGPIADWSATAPPVPLPLGEDDDGVVLENPVASHDVFPFLLTTRHPVSTRAAREPRVVRCPGVTSLPLYVELAGLRGGAGAGPAMLAAAKTFLATAPPFVPALGALGSPYGAFPALWSELCALPGAQSLEALGAVAARTLAMSAAEFLAQPAADAARGGLWQSVFALSLAAPVLATLPVPGLDPASLVLGIRIFGFLGELCASSAWLTEEQPRREALAAIAILPDAVTPPPATQGSPSGWAQLLGAGRLKTIRQHLTGYDAGEIAFTVNLMPHESWVLTDRCLSRTEESSRTLDVDTTTSTTREESEGSSELEREIADLVASESSCKHYDDTKTYGDNALSYTFAGTTTGTLGGSSRGTVAAGTAAQRLTRLAASRIERRATRERRRQLIEERERISRTEIDNRAGEARQVGIYRWLRKVYGMSLVDRGGRLVVELLVASPAAAYLTLVDTDAGAPLVAPTAPSSLSPPIDGPTDVTATNYRSLVTRYRATDVRPPPEQIRIVTETYRSPGDAVVEAMTLPAGYQAKTAWVTVLRSDRACSLIGVLGDWSFTVPAVPPAPAAPTPPADAPATCPPPPDPFAPGTPPVPAATSLDPQTLPVNSDGPSTGSLPVSLLCGAPFYSASLAVSTELLDFADTFAAWQQEAYAAVVAGYDRQLLEFRGARRDRIAATSHDRRREIETGALRSAGLAILWALETGGAGTDEPSYLRYLDRAFEWKEMAYELYPWTTGAPRITGRDWPGEALLDPGSDVLFASFLAAGSARVLVPVTPGEELDVLFYLLYGSLPPWSRGDVPLAEAQLARAGELLSPGFEAAQAASERWTIEVPTSHLVLQDGAALPTFERGKKQRSRS